MSEIPSDSCSRMRMIVGLGNPGSEYAGTRHNTGFEVADMLAGRLGTGIKSRRFGGWFGQAQTAARTLLFLKPGRYMNKSGQVVATAVGFYRLAIENLIVVTDDMALEPGVIRIRASGSSGGHKGLKDIIDRLGSENFARLRIGIGQDRSEDAADFVLSRPDAGQGEILQQARERAVDAILCWVQDGIDAAMTRFNSRPSDDRPAE